MDNRIKVQGIILSVMPVGDYDRRITILTKERGRLSAFAQGARRTGNALLAKTQLCTLGTFYLYMGRDNYRVSEVEVLDYFTDFRVDLEKAYHAMYFCEVASYFTRENNDEREMLNLVYAALKALEKGVLDRTLIKAVFELKAMCISGEAPSTGECVICHEKKEKRVFSVEHGGMVCTECAAKLPGRFTELSESAWYAVWYIASTPASGVFSFKLSDAVLAEVAAVASAYLKGRTGHEFKGERLLEIV
ncbi:MAG: DNA repair protein RecO [Lachnospiraceae bacterium]|nr:DNA repair protein RecO [Lachnospiraceae bacterium]